MSLSLFTFADIKQKVRNLTGHKSTGDLSESRLEDYINRYYQLVFPLDVRPNELASWFEFTTVIDQDSYDLTSVVDFPSGVFADNFLTIESPAYVDGYPLQMYQSPELFFDKWSQTSTFESQRPVDVLFYDRKLLFRQPPDDEYEVKIAAWKRPDALVNSGDFPSVEEWGTIISYGASREIAEDYGDIESLQTLEPLYQKHRTYLSNKVHFQNSNARAIPTW